MTIIQFSPENFDINLESISYCVLKIHVNNKNSSKIKLMGSSLMS